VTDARPFALERVAAIEGPTVASPGDMLARWSPHLDGQALFIGDGAMKYRDEIEGAAPAAHVAAPPPLAAIIGRLALAHAVRGETVDPAGIQPLYVRRPDAEIDREKRRASR
jgi:tRNA A37 threonylcarbamoyladenosine modification protein TsaB